MYNAMPGGGLEIMHWCTYGGVAGAETDRRAVAVVAMPQVTLQLHDRAQATRRLWLSHRLQQPRRHHPIRSFSSRPPTPLVYVCTMERVGGERESHRILSDRFLCLPISLITKPSLSLLLPSLSAISSGIHYEIPM